MRVGLIGAGSMAAAIARGWGEPVLVSDTGSGRARALADELGGEAFSSNSEVAARADLLVLCHKPYHLKLVAEQLHEFRGPVVSILGATTTADLQAAYPGCPVYSLMPNTPVEIREGVCVYAEREPAEHAPDHLEFEPQVLDLFARLGKLVTVPERLMNVATAVSGVGPAYQALLVEAQVDAAVRHGLGADLAADLVTATMRGSAALISVRGNDTLAVRREVTSPGGSTARGIAALEDGNVRTAFQAATDAVVTGSGPGPR